MVHHKGRQENYNQEKKAQHDKIKCIQENYRNRNKPVEGVRKSMGKMLWEVDDCKGRNLSSVSLNFLY